MSASKWFVCPIPRPSAELRLVCLPYAGGSASTYASWAKHLPAEVELIGVQSPGRASRISEQPHSEMSTLVADLASAFHRLIDKPYILFGHSLGSRVAYEFSKQCPRLGLPQPRLLIASGSRAPHFPSERTSVYDLPDTKFIDKLRELNGTPEEVLSNHELLQFLIPLLRADFKIADMYRAAPSRLDCPIVVLAGTEDWEVTETAVEGWRELSNGQFAVRWIPGGHFFVEQNRSLVLEMVNAEIAQIVRADRIA